MGQSLTDLNEMLVFARVVQAGSFTAAAEALGMPKSTVSRRVGELETRLGARLLQRTTRSISLTDAGSVYYEHCARVVAEAEEAERAVGSLRDRPVGTLRVTAPLSFAFLGPVVAEFLARYPEVRLELVCTDRLVDLVEERFDVAVRAGALADSSLVARPLGSFPFYLVASPAWVAAHGEPTSPDALREAEWLVFGVGERAARVRFERGREAVELALRPRVLVNDFDLLERALLAGLGVGLLPAFECAREIAEGRLARLLPEWTTNETKVHAVYPTARHLSPKVERFVEHLKARLPAAYAARTAR